MKKEQGKLCSIIIRYALLLILGFSLWLLYDIFTPLTVYPVFWILNLFYHTSMSGVLINLEGFPIYLLKACIAGSAYYLLLILNLTTPLNLKKRIFSILFSVFLFLLINIARIIVFSVLFITSFSLFNQLHLIFWYFISAFIVLLIWIATIKLFKIKEIPVYSDLKFLVKLIKNKT